MVRVILCKALHQAAERGLHSCFPQYVCGPGLLTREPSYHAAIEDINSSTTNASAAGRFSAVIGSLVSGWGCCFQSNQDKQAGSYIVRDASNQECSRGARTEKPPLSRERLRPGLLRRDASWYARGKNL